MRSFGRYHAVPIFQILSKLRPTDSILAINQDSQILLCIQDTIIQPQEELIAILKTPIQVRESDATIEFKEIVIVETGQANTTYGDEEFWDYVILEGSQDGINWTPLLDGYDSDSDEEWLSAYNSQKIGDPSMYKERSN